MHEAGTADVSSVLAEFGAADIVALTDELTAATLTVDSLPEAEELPGVGYLRVPVVVSIPVDPDPTVELDEPAGRSAPGLPKDATSPSARGDVQIGWGGSNALARVRTDAWHRAGITGKGVKVGIVDYFYKPYWDWAHDNGDLPAAPAGTFCRMNRVTCSSTVFWNQATHGVSVAEAIQDIAPGATLYLATVETTEDLKAAIDYFAANGVKIISRSLGAQFDGPGDGTGPSAALIDYAVSKGMTWVNSAGNHGVRSGYLSSEARTIQHGGYWRGTWRDTNGDSWLEFVDPRGIVGPSEFLVSYCNVWLQGLRWNDWGSTKTDYDLHVYAWSGDSWLPAGSSQNRQQGNTTTAPLERPASIACTGNQLIAYAIYKHADGNGTAGDTLELMANGSMWDYVSNDGSAGQPFADTKNRGGLSVGAVAVSTGEIAAYSSRGPLNDGRKKPDVSAVSEFSSVSADNYVFTGTSAATPIVSGVAALILQKYPQLKPAQLGDYLRTNAAFDRGPSGIDNTYGAGEIGMPLLSTKAPKISGTVKVGTTLKASAGTWADSGVKLGYQWLRNGKPISGAKSTKYKLVAADAGARIGLRETASKSGFRAEITTVESSKKVAAIPVKVKKLSYTGTLKVGKKLKAKLSGLSPASAKVKYQWYRGSKAISGAKKSSYKLKKTDRGKKITLKATITAKHYLKTVKKYAKSAKVKK